MTPEERAALEDVKALVGKANRKLKKLLAEEPTPSDPFDGLSQIATLNSVSDWHHLLEENGVVSDISSGIQFDVPPNSNRVRCELQFARDTQPIPGENGYRWNLFIPSTCNISPDQRGLTGGATIMQTHTDVDQAHGGGYSGGMALRSDNVLVQRITGNKPEEDEVLGLAQIGRDRRYKIETRIVWREDPTGSVKTWLNDKLILDLTNITTCPDGATSQKFRLGWYADPCLGLSMIVDGVEVYG